MKQPLIGLLLVALAFISGYEIQRSKRKPPVSESPSYMNPLSQQAGRTSTQPGVPGNAARVERLRAQRRKVEELSQQVKVKETEVAALNQRLNNLTSKTAAPDMPVDDLQKQVSEVQANIQHLNEQKQYILQQASQRALAGQTGIEEFKVRQERMAEEYRKKIATEKESLQATKQLLSGVEATNLDLDGTQSLKVKAKTQEERVRKLQTEFQQYQMDSARDLAAQQVMVRQQSQAQDAQMIAGIDQQILEQQKRLDTLQKNLQAAGQSQQLGQETVESLSEKYQAAREEYDQLLEQYQAEKAELDRLSA